MRSFISTVNNNEQKYNETCNKIKADPNYWPNVTDEPLFNAELLDLVRYEKSQFSKHQPKKDALAFLDSNIETNLGKVFQIKIAKKGYPDVDDEFPVWFIDNSAVILVEKESGKASIHKTENAKKGDFKHPLDIKLDSFLGRECLHQTPLFQNCNVL